MNNKRIDAGIKMAVRQRNYRKARDRALTRLAQKYPDEYKKLYKQERERDEKMGTRYTTDTYIAGSSSASRTRKNRTKSISKRRKR